MTDSAVTDSAVAGGDAPGDEGPMASAAGTGRDWLEPVSRRPLPVALVAAVVVAAMGWRVGLRPELPALVYLGVVGAMLAFIDVALHRLPDPLTLPSYPIAAVLLGIAVPFTEDGGTRYLHALAGLGALLLLYLVQWFIAPSAIGLGDVKLSGALGLYLGWYGMPAWTLGVFAMYMLGGACALALLAARRATRKTAIPFGPFMLAGTLVAIVYHGGQI